MKKLWKALVTCFACLGIVLLVGCSNVSQSYADKINEEAKDDDGVYITLDQVRKDLGDEAVEILLLNSGLVIAVKGCTSLDQIKEKVDAGEDVEGIVITILNKNATAASYRKITADDLKGK